jgi:hypothetical protein
MDCQMSKDYLYAPETSGVLIRIEMIGLMLVRLD